MVEIVAIVNHKWIMDFSSEILSCQMYAHAFWNVDFFYSFLFKCQTRRSFVIDRHQACHDKENRKRRKTEKELKIIGGCEMVHERKQMTKAAESDDDDNGDADER